MAARTLLAKRNGDGSFSVSYSVGDLVNDSFVDFYNEQTGAGFQRNETTRPKRGRDVAEYVRRCVRDGVNPKLFELTANARVGEPCDADDNWSYEPLDESGTLGFLSFTPPKNEGWLSLTDGGTRCLGIEIALSRGDLDPQWTVDVRIFVNLSLAQEIAQFLLINDCQKKVRTDLGLRVVQRIFDEGTLSADEVKILQTVVPDTESWKFEASRIAAEMNVADDSPWRNRIQMPGDPPRSTTLQSFFTSLAPILNDPDIKAAVDQMVTGGELDTDRTDFIIQMLKNFWRAVANVNPKADNEPETNVLWAPIGSSACHMALATVVKTILDSSEPNVKTDRFTDMLDGSEVAEYGYWYTKRGKNAENQYPTEKGEATVMTGASNYKRLARELEQSWRSNLHAKPGKRQVLV